MGAKLICPTLEKDRFSGPSTGPENPRSAPYERGRSDTPFLRGAACRWGILLTVRVGRGSGLDDEKCGVQDDADHQEEPLDPTDRPVYREQ